MKEVSCLVICQPDWDQPFLIKPYKVLVPESQHGKPESDAERVLNHVADVGYSDTVVTEFSDKLGKQLWDSVDWDDAEKVDSTPQEPEDALSLWRCLSGRGRSLDLEPIIAQDDHIAEVYSQSFEKSSWVNWTDEELVRNPCWLFMYAQQVMKGKLPENLHSAMIMHSFSSPENKYVKRYCRGRRYKYHCKKNLRPEVRFCVEAV